MNKKRRNHKKLQISIGTEKFRVLLNPQNLSFPKELEGKFHRDYYKSSLMMLRYSFMLGIVYYAGFALLDNYALPEIKFQLYTIRFVVVCPVILIVLLMSYTKKFYKWWQLAAFTSVMVSGLGIIVMLVIAPELGRNTYYAGIILVLIYNYMLVKLRFIWSSVAGFIIFASYVFAMLIFPDYQPKIFGINTFFLFSGNLLGMFGGYTLEYYSRRDFYFRYLLDKERKKVKMDNVGLEEIVHEKTKELKEDIRKRKEIEIALRESEKKYRNIITLAPIGFYQSIPNGEIVTANDELAAILGFDSSSELKESCNMKDLYFANEREDLINKYDEFSVEKIRNIEVKFKKKDGTPIWVLLTLQSVKNLDGTTKYYDGFVIDITNIKNKEEEIQHNLEEKNLLLRELYHRTKNNMQVIASMLKIKGRMFKNEILQKTIQEIVNKIISMSMVHQKLYEARNLSQINLKEYIEDFVVHLMSNYNSKDSSVTLRLQLENVQITIDSAVPMGIIITELVSNVYKHAFPNDERGEIYIGLQKTETGNVKISFSDNGIGINSNEDLRTMSNIGLKNVFSLVEYQLRGKIEYHVNKGLHWNIEFSDNVYKKRI